MKRRNIIIVTPVAMAMIMSGLTTEAFAAPRSPGSGVSQSVPLDTTEEKAPSMAAQQDYAVAADGDPSWGSVSITVGVNKVYEQTTEMPADTEFSIDPAWFGDESVLPEVREGLTIDPATGDLIWSMETDNGVNNPHEYSVPVVVTYSDNSTRTVNVPVTFAPPMARQYLSSNSDQTTLTYPGRTLHYPLSELGQIPTGTQITLTPITAVAQTNIPGDPGTPSFEDVSATVVGDHIVLSSPEDLGAEFPVMNSYLYTWRVDATFPDGSTTIGHEGPNSPPELTFRVDAPLSRMFEVTVDDPISAPRGMTSTSGLTMVPTRDEQTPEFLGSIFTATSTNFEITGLPQDWDVTLDTETRRLSVSVPDGTELGEYDGMLRVEYLDTISANPYQVAGDVVSSETPFTIRVTDPMSVLHDPDWDPATVPLGGDGTFPQITEDLPEGTIFEPGPDWPPGLDYVSVDPDTGTITVTDAPTDPTTAVLPVTVTYPDGSSETIEVNLVVAEPMADEYGVGSYPATNILNPGSTLSLDPVDEAEGGPYEFPEGTVFTATVNTEASQQDYEDMQWSIDPATGQVTVTSPDPISNKNLDRPSVLVLNVMATFPDGSAWPGPASVQVNQMDTFDNMIEGVYSPVSSLVGTDPVEMTSDLSWEFENEYSSESMAASDWGSMLTTGLELLPGLPENWNASILPPGVPDAGRVTVTVPAGTPSGEYRATVRAAYANPFVSGGDPIYDDFEVVFVVEGVMADDHDPLWGPADVIRDSEVTVDQTSELPEGTTFEIDPEWTPLVGVTATVDPNTGAVTVATDDTTVNGEYEVPVVVTYPDESTETVDVTVTVIDSMADRYPLTLPPGGELRHGSTNQYPLTLGGAPLPEDMPEFTVEFVSTGGSGGFDPDTLDLSFDAATDTVSVTTVGDDPYQGLGNYDYDVVVTFPDGAERVVDLSLDRTLSMAQMFDMSHDPVTVRQGGTVTGPVTVVGEQRALDAYADDPAELAAMENTIEYFDLGLIQAEYEVTGAPEGWTVEVDDSGAVTVTPPDDAELGEHEITVTARYFLADYPDGETMVPRFDGSSDVSVLTVNVEPSDATTYDPAYTGGDVKPGRSVDLPQDGDVPDDAEIAVEGLPDDWTSEVLPDQSIRVTAPADATPDDNPVTATVTVTYEDGSSDEVTVEMTVVALDSQVFDTAYTADPVKPGQTATATPSPVLPEGSSAEVTGGLPDGWTATVAEDGTVTVVTTEGTPAGIVPVIVTVAYSDGSTEEFTADVEVLPLDSATFDPSYGPVDATAGDEIDAEVLTEAPLPSGTEFSLGTLPTGWSVEIDPVTGAITGQVPHATGTDEYTIPVTVAYPDGSSEEISLVLAVTATDLAGDHDPSYSPVTIRPNTPGSAELVSEDDLPDGTTFEVTSSPEGWNAVVDTDGTVTWTAPAGTEPGEDTIEVTVTYIDGTTDTAQVTVTVLPSFAAETDPVYTSDPVKPDATEVTAIIEAPLPEGSEVVVEDLPDGWTAEVDEDGNITVTLPGGETPAGEYPAEATITYPDGSTDTVDVTFTVDPWIADGYEAVYTVPGDLRPGETVPATISEAIPEGSTVTVGQLPEGWTSEVDAEGDITLTPPAGTEVGASFTVPVTITHSDGSVTETSVQVTVGDFDSSVHDVTSEVTGEVKPGRDITVTVTAEPELPSGSETVVTAPEGWTVTDNGDGTYTVSVPEDAEVGSTETVTVTVTYSDGSTDVNPHQVTVEALDNASFDPSYETDGPMRPGQPITATQIDGPGADATYEATTPEGWEDGSVTVAEDGTVTITPPADYTGPVETVVTITYPDGSTDTVTVTAEISPWDSEGQDPSYTVTDPEDIRPGDDITATISDPIPPGSTVEVDLPDGWTAEVDSGGNVVITPAPGTDTGGDYEFPVTVTYPDGSTDETTISVTVPDFDAEGVEVSVDGPGEIKPGRSIDAAVIATPELPADATITAEVPENWTYEVIDGVIRVTAPSDAVVGSEHEVSVTVTYADGSTDTATFPVSVEALDNAAYDPRYEVTTPDPRPGQPVVADQIDGPGSDATYTVTTPEGWEPGSVTVSEDGTVTVVSPADHTGPVDVTVTVTYPDGSTDEAPVTVTVDPWDSAGQDPVYTVDEDIRPGDDITATISDPVPPGSTVEVDLPDGWTSEVDEDGNVAITPPEDTTEGGDYEFPVTITYPDGSTDETTITVTVPDFDAEGVEVTVDGPEGVKPGQSIDATVVATPELPEGATITAEVPEGWTSEVIDEIIRVTAPADAEVGSEAVITAVVTYTDGSVDRADLPVTVTALDNADYDPSYEVEGDPRPGEPVTATQVDGPGADATYEVTAPEGWEPGSVTVDENGTVTITPPADYTGPVEVEVTITYPDGSTDTVTVSTEISDWDSTGYDPSYTVEPVKPGGSTTADQIDGPGPDATYEVGPTPDGVNITVDEDGTVNVTVNPDAEHRGQVDVPITITYPDGSTDVVDVTVRVIPTDSEAYDPGYEVPPVQPGNPTTGEQIGDVPQGTTFEEGEGTPPGWEVDIDPNTGEVTITPPADAEPDEYTIPVDVTYPDGSTETVDIPVTVTESDAATHDPAYTEPSVQPGGTTTAEQTGEVPPGTTFSGTVPEGWTGGVDPNTGTVTVTPPAGTPVGDHEVTVTVTYPDGSTEDVQVTITVTPSDSDLYDPGYEVGPVVPGQPVTAVQTGDLPDGTEFEVEAPGGWETSVDPNTGDVTLTPPNGTEPGDYPVTVTVTYPDGTTEDFEISVEISQGYQATYPNVTGKPGETTTVSPTSPAPEGTTWEIDGPTDWDFEVGPDGAVTVTIPEGTDPGTETVTVTYTTPSGNTGEAEFTVTIPTPDATDADTYDPEYGPITGDPGETVTTDPVGEVPPGTGFEVDGPEDWEVTVDPETGTVTVVIPEDTAPGDYEVTVTVTYPDGSTDEVTTTVTVNEPVTTPPTSDPATPSSETTTPSAPSTPTSRSSEPSQPSRTTSPTSRSSDPSRSSQSSRTSQPSQPSRANDPTRSSQANAQPTPVAPPLDTGGAELIPIGEPKGPVVDTGGTVSQSWWAKLVSLLR